MVWSRPVDCFRPGVSSLGFWSGDLGGGVLLLLHGEIEPRKDDLFVASAMPFRTALTRAGNRSNVMAYNWMPCGVMRLEIAPAGEVAEVRILVELQAVRWFKY